MVAVSINSADLYLLEDGVTKVAKEGKHVQLNASSRSQHFIHCNVQLSQLSNDDVRVIMHQSPADHCRSYLFNTAIFIKHIMYINT